MDSMSMNPYEQQLYTVFKTFDVDNEEALDKSAVLDLCDALQLEDRGAALVNTLFERRADRVTFTQFRNGLLSVLSTADRCSVQSVPDPIPVSTPPSFPTSTGAPPSDEDSSGREVAPKFVFGSKKYGRRSRPQRAAAASDGSPRAASVSRLDAEDRRNRSSQRMRFKRSASAMESRDLNSTIDDDDGVPGEIDHDRRINRNQALALCRDLRMDGIDASLVERIFEDSRDNETTVGEFFDRLNASLTSSIESSREPGPAVVLLDDDAADEDAGIVSELVVDAWERAGVPRPRRLLLDLGFGSSAVRPADLERALDDETAALGEPFDERRDPRPTLLAAALALGRLRLARARRRADIAAAERDKLRADVSEANRRAQLLALDVDESHARMEAELAANLRRTEARYAEAAKQAADEAVAERERAASLRVRLEAEVTRRAEAEVRARCDLDAEKERGVQAEARAVAAEARVAVAEREAESLAEHALRVTEAAGAGAGAGAGVGAGDAAVGELHARLDELRREVQQLRDRNDELCGLLEARAAPRQTAADSACGDLSAELRSLLGADAIEETDSSPVSIDQKMVDYVEVVKRLRLIFETVQSVPTTERTSCDSCVCFKNYVMEVQTRVRELSDLAVPVEPSERSRDAFTETDPVGEVPIRDEETQRYRDLIRELEGSLEQMRDEYERCEEYWARKLDDERAAYDDERRAGDERLAELVARVADYERTFAPARALPPIEERVALEALEAQLAELERECAEHRARAQADAAELRRLREAVPAPAPAPAPSTATCSCAALAERCGRLGACLAAARGAGAREAAALRSRAARAEAAVRRLTARLHAADLLVKDLYVENCHLAHRRAP